MSSAIPEILERLERLKELTEDAGCEFPDEILGTAKQLSGSFEESGPNSDMELSVSSDESPDHKVRVAAMVSKIREKNKSINREVERKLKKLKKANSHILRNNSTASYSYHGELNSIRDCLTALELENNKSKETIRQIKSANTALFRSTISQCEENESSRNLMIGDQTNKEFPSNSSEEIIRISCSNCTLL